jgi:hypothetical protein
MKFRLVVAMIALVIGACSPPAAASALDSGIEGHATVGPSCPVQRVDVLCPDRPYTGELVVFSEDGKVEVARVQPDAEGYFRLALAPGRYVMRPATPGPLPRAADTLVEVQAHVFQQLDIAFDSGIR